ncbi:FUSC family protein [Demequina zhanjiangensis]|uniref:FUSC family protein n=1 Tax=Demequina zhanjiangensis TaxID=3051659 RepID=A0ABT8FYT7_9MICO|nr:FUSC family protein [Demequina sp. SYSU T00b26]MDN4472066.1 FUSC family protein [Demequina sp. SYSU T00b26]
MTARSLRRPPAKAWTLAIVATLGIGAILAGAAMLAGADGLVPALLGVVGMVGLAPREAPMPAKAGMVALLAVSGGAAAAVGADAALLPLVVGATALATIPFTIRYGAVALAVPVLPAVIGALGGQGGPWSTALLAAFGALGVAVVVRLIGLKAPATPVKVPVAWGHGIVLALLAAVAVAVVLWQEWGHGYWMVIGLCVVLSPEHLKVRAETGARVVGTAIGAVVAIGLAVVLPHWLVLVVAGVAMVAALAYAAIDRRVELIALQTITVVSAGAAADPDTTWEIALARVVAIGAGAVVALIGAELVVAGLERRVEESEQNGAPASDG